MNETMAPASVVSEAFWETGSAARYMAQLCKHFAHRVSVTLNEHDGRIVFDAGSCDLGAEGAGLRLRASAGEEAALLQVQSVVIRHLQRFAFREMTEEAAAAIIWVRV